MAGRSRRPRIAALLGLALAWLGCSSSPRLVHVVGRGENLYRIGKAYGVDYRDLARLNGIADPARIEVGQRIVIPGATRRLPVDVIAPRYADAARPEFGPPGGRPWFRWPTREGTLSSGFGPRRGTFHDGVDIAAPEGTPVYAARDGRVIYSDRIPGYGNVVIVSHERGLSTVYAHNSRNRVAAGDAVKEGEVVSLVGSTGRTTGPNLHFEVRVDNVARNPLFYLPPLPSTIARSE